MARKRIVDVKSAKKILGEEKIEEIVNKEWKTAELPSEEEISNEQSSNPMARNNINSRKNLIQYKKDKPKEVKEAIINGLQYPIERRDFDFETFFGEYSTPQMKEVLLPMRESLLGEDEEDVFFGTIRLYIRDFPKDGLSNSDLDDISTLALNRILELRLLKAAKEKPSRLLDCSRTIDQFRASSEKIKKGLASRRTDRLDTTQKGGISIVDLAVAFDDVKKKALEDKTREVQEGIEKFLAGKEGTLISDGKE
jgi:hypothetical protein